MIDDEYLKLEHVLDKLNNFTIIKKCVICYVNDDSEKEKKLVLEDNPDVLLIFDELADKVKIVSYQLYFEKYFVFHFLDDETESHDVWNLGGIRIDSDYTLILSFERLIEELSDFDDYRTRMAYFEGKKGLEWD